MQFTLHKKHGLHNVLTVLSRATISHKKKFVKNIQTKFYTDTTSDS